MKKIAIIGAGISGVSLALMLKDNFRITIFEKSNMPGGRMATKKIGPFIFDYGTQYFKIKNKFFKDFLKPLFTNSIIQPWTSKHIKIKNNIKHPCFYRGSANNYVGVPNMNSIIQYLSSELDISLRSKVVWINRKNNKWTFCDINNNHYDGFDWLIFTTPVEQTCKIVPEVSSFYNFIKNIRMMKCYSLLLGFYKRFFLNFDTATLFNNDIAWISRNNSKPARPHNLCLVLNSSYEFAKKNNNSSKNTIFQYLLNKSYKLINNPKKPDVKYLHKWNFVEAKKHPKDNYFIDIRQKIAVCGDWCVNSRVEGGFLSARDLASKIKC